MQKTVSNNANTIVAFIAGAILSTALSISANNRTNSGENGRYQVAITNANSPARVHLVIIDTQSGEIAHKEKFRMGDWK